MDTIAGLAVHGARRRAAGRVVPWGARTELYVQPYIQHGVGVEGKGKGKSETQGEGKAEGETQAEGKAH